MKQTDHSPYRNSQCAEFGNSDKYIYSRDSVPAGIYQYGFARIYSISHRLSSLQYQCSFASKCHKASRQHNGCINFQGHQCGSVGMLNMTSTRMRLISQISPVDALVSFRSSIQLTRPSSHLILEKWINKKHCCLQERNPKRQKGNATRYSMQQLLSYSVLNQIPSSESTSSVSPAMPAREGVLFAFLVL